MKARLFILLSLIVTMDLLVPGRARPMVAQSEPAVSAVGFANTDRAHMFTSLVPSPQLLDGNTVIFSDDFSTDPNTNGLWTVHRYADDLGNEASWDSDHEVLYLTRAAGPRASAIFANYQLDSPWWEASFRYRVGGGSGADGLVFMFNKDAQAYGAPNAGGTLGFLTRGTGWDPVPGYGVEFDTYYNTSDPSSNHIAIIEDTPRNHLVSISDSRTEDNVWHDVVISFDNGHIEVFLDGDAVLGYTLVDPNHTYTGVGFAAATWSYNNNHIIDDFVLRTADEAGFSVSGHVYDVSGDPIPNVTVSAGANSSTDTNASGAYTITNLITGTYTLTPTKSGWMFMPVTRIVSVPPDATGQDFTALRDVPYFSQRDSRWINHPLRGCSVGCDTIGECGCTLTSAAMVFGYYGSDLNPPTLSDCMGERACPFYWRTGAACSEGAAQWVNRHSFSWSRLEQELDQQPVILGMHRGLNTHWVVVLGGSGSNPANYTIHDPWPINGAVMRLNAYSSHGWHFDWLAIYTEQPSSQRPTTATDQRTFHPQSVVAATDPEMASRQSTLTVAEALSLAPSSVITGSVRLYRMTDVTMTVQLVADSEAGDVTEMLVWTDSMTQTIWQPFSTFVYLPVSDEIYARFRDVSDNVSETSGDTLYPVASPPTAPFEIFLPLILKQ